MLLSQYCIKSAVLTMLQESLVLYKLILFRLCLRYWRGSHMWSGLLFLHIMPAFGVFKSL
jgi:hypothetical protein